MQAQKTKKRLKVKETIDNTRNVKDTIKALNTKYGRPVMPKHVLKLTDWLYITCDCRQWILREVNDKINPTTGEKYPDKSLCYASTLDYMLKLASRYSIQVPKEIKDINDRINDVYNLIDSRIPANIKPKDLFEEYNREQDEYEE